MGGGIDCDSGPIPDSKRLSVATITTEQLEQLVQPFRAAIPVAIEGRAADFLPDVAGTDDVASAVTFKGETTMTREGLADRPAVVRACWHVLLPDGRPNY